MKTIRYEFQALAVGMQDTACKAINSEVRGVTATIVQGQNSLSGMLKITGEDEAVERAERYVARHSVFKCLFGEKMI